MEMNLKHTLFGSYAFLMGTVLPYVAMACNQSNGVHFPERLRLTYLNRTLLDNPAINLTLLSSLHTFLLQSL